MAWLIRFHITATFFLAGVQVTSYAHAQEAAPECLVARWAVEQDSTLSFVDATLGPGGCRAIRVDDIVIQPLDVLGTASEACPFSGCSSIHLANVLLALVDSIKSAPAVHPSADCSLSCQASIACDDKPLPDEPSDLHWYVNKIQSIPDWYAPGSLIELPSEYVVRPNYLRADAWESEHNAESLVTWDGLPVGYQGKVGFKPMLDEVAAVEGRVLVRSAYRSYDTQYNTFFGKWVPYEEGKGLSRDDAIEAASRYSAKPGHSEHQLGTAADVVFVRDDGTPDNPDEYEWDPSVMASHAAMSWIAANAHRFGIVMSYPEGKESITGYSWEPWHFRFVGIELADAIRLCGVTTEEILAARYRIQ